MDLTAWKTLLLAIIAFPVVSTAFEFDVQCVNYVHTRNHCMDCSSHTEVADMAFFALLKRYLGPQVGSYSLHDDNNKDRECDQASSSLVFCRSVVPEAPDVCQPVDNPAMNLSGLCSEVWYYLQLFSPLYTPRNGPQLISRFYSLTELYCNSSVAPTCPPLNDNKTIDPTCSFPFVQRSNGRGYNKEHFNGYLVRQTGAVTELLNTLIAANDTDLEFSARVECIYQQARLYEHKEEHGCIPRTTKPENITKFLKIRTLLIDDLVDHFVKDNNYNDNHTVPFTKHLEKSRCAWHCNREGAYIDTQLISFISNWGRFSSFVQMLFPLLVVVSGICSGFEAAWEYPNRLMIYLAVAVLFYSSFLWPHLGELFGGPNIACNSDNSLAFSDELKASSLAQFSCIMNKVGVAVYRMALFFVTFAWWQLVIRLQLGKQEKWYCIQVSGLVEVIAFILTAVWAATLASVQSTGVYSVGVIIHACVIKHSTLTLHFGVDITALLLSCLIMGDGGRRLLGLYKLTTLVRNHPSSTIVRDVNDQKAARKRTVSDITVGSDRMAANDVLSGPPGQDRGTFLKQDSKQSLSFDPQSTPTVKPAVSPAAWRKSSRESIKQQSRLTTAQKGLNELIKRFGLIIMGALITGSSVEFVLTFVKLFSEDDVAKLNAQRSIYYRCITLTCGNADQCNPLRPSLPYTVSMVLILYPTLDIISAVLLCAGVFSPLWWRTKLSSRQKSQRRSRSMASQLSLQARNTILAMETPSYLPQPNTIAEESPEDTTNTAFCSSASMYLASGDLLGSEDFANSNFSLRSEVIESNVDVQGTEVVASVYTNEATIHKSAELITATSGKASSPPALGHLLQMPAIVVNDSHSMRLRHLSTLTALELRDDDHPDPACTGTGCAPAGGMAPGAEADGSQQQTNRSDTVIDDGTNTLANSASAEGDWETAHTL